MRKSHIDFLKSMVSSISFDGVPFFGDSTSQAKFMETYPPVDLFQSVIPICVIHSVKINDNLDGRQNPINRRKALGRISPVTDSSGNRFLRSLWEDFKQEFVYILHFIIRDPTRDILSDVDKPGILDQCKRFISQNPSTISKVILPANPVTSEPIDYSVAVDVSTSELISQYAADGFYILSISVIFRDKLVTLLEEPALDIEGVEILQPVGVSWES